MNKTQLHKLRDFFRKRWVSISVIIVACIAAAGLIVWYNSSTNDKIEQDKVRTSTMVDKVDQQIKDIKERKAAELAAQQKAEAEAKAKEAAAEQSKPVAQAPGSPKSPSTCNSSTSHNNPASIDVMVNKKHCIQPLSFAPGDLVTANGATLSAKAIDSYNRMYAAAVAAGQGFSVSSSYRSYATQVSTYNYWVSVSGQAGADTYSARPGYSEHQTGLVIDVAANGCALSCFGSTSQYQWFQQNAADFGFIQRYYAGHEATTGYTSEEWHYRYVGVAVAKDMQARGIKTLEQYWGMPGGTY